MLDLRVESRERYAAGAAELIGELIAPFRQFHAGDIELLRLLMAGTALRLLGHQGPLSVRVVVDQAESPGHWKRNCRTGDGWSPPRYPRSTRHEWIGGHRNRHGNLASDIHPSRVASSFFTQLKQVTLSCGNRTIFLV